jgi:hypothetical protein
MTTGTKSGLQEWIRKNLGMTYTSWMYQKREVRAVQYNKYQRGVVLNPLNPLPATPVKPVVDETEAVAA